MITEKHYIEIPLYMSPSITIWQGSMPDGQYSVSFEHEHDSSKSLNKSELELLIKFLQSALEKYED